MKKFVAMFVLAFGLAAVAQDAATVQPQLTQVPPKPTCHWIFNSGSCNDLWRAYNQAVAQRTREELQLYVNQQKALTSSQTAAPLRQQIEALTQLNAEQQEQVKELQDQVQAAPQARSDAHRKGIELGVGIGAGSMLLLFVLIFGIAKLTRSTMGKPLARGASA